MSERCPPYRITVGYERDVHNGEQQCWSSSVYNSENNVRKVPISPYGWVLLEILVTYKRVIIPVLIPNSF